MPSLYYGHNHHIYVRKDDLLSIKGHFTQALEDQTAVAWEVKDGKLVLPILFVCSALVFLAMC
jgi:hypothetical protein